MTLSMFLKTNVLIIMTMQNVKTTELSLHGNCTIIGIFTYFFFLWRALQHPYDIVLTYVLFHVLSQNLFLLNIFVLK